MSRSNVAPLAGDRGGQPLRIDRYRLATTVGEPRGGRVAVVVVLEALAHDQPGREVVVARVVRGLEVAPADGMAERVDDPPFDRVAHHAEPVARSEAQTPVPSPSTTATPRCTR